MRDSLILLLACLLCVLCAGRQDDQWEELTPVEQLQERAPGDDNVRPLRPLAQPPHPRVSTGSTDDLITLQKGDMMVFEWGNSIHAHGHTMIIWENKQEIEPCSKKPAQHISVSECIIPGCSTKFQYYVSRGDSPVTLYRLRQDVKDRTHILEQLLSINQKIMTTGKKIPYAYGHRLAGKAATLGLDHHLNDKQMNRLFDEFDTLDRNFLDPNKFLQALKKALSDSAICSEWTTYLYQYAIWRSVHRARPYETLVKGSRKRGREKAKVAIEQIMPFYADWVMPWDMTDLNSDKYWTKEMISITYPANRDVKSCAAASNQLMAAPAP